MYKNILFSHIPLAAFFLHPAVLIMVILPSSCVFTHKYVFDICGISYTMKSYHILYFFPCFGKLSISMSQVFFFLVPYINIPDSLLVDAKVAPVLHCCKLSCKMHSIVMHVLCDYFCKTICKGIIAVSRNTSIWNT